jgi:hypothetical protein
MRRGGSSILWWAQGWSGSMAFEAVNHGRGCSARVFVQFAVSPRGSNTGTIGWMSMRPSSARVGKGVRPRIGDGRDERAHYAPDIGPGSPQLPDESDWVMRMRGRMTRQPTPCRGRSRRVGQGVQRDGGVWQRFLVGDLHDSSGTEARPRSRVLRPRRRGSRGGGSAAWPAAAGSGSS